MRISCLRQLWLQKVKEKKRWVKMSSDRLWSHSHAADSDWMSEESGSGRPVSFDSPAAQINKLSLESHSSFTLTPVRQLEILICLFETVHLKFQVDFCTKQILIFSPNLCYCKPWNTIKHILSSKISKTHHFNQCWGPLSCKLGPHSQYPKQIIFIRFPKPCHWFVKLWMIMKLSG